MGILISFSGFDGAGKSTQVDLLSKYLKSKGKRVYTTEAMFQYFLLKPLVVYLRKATSSPTGGPVKRNERFLFKLWFIPAFIDIWLGYLFEIRPTLSRYDFLIADRFYTDIWANLLYYGYIPTWAFKLFIKFLPKSDLALMLLVKPESVFKRESEFPQDYYYEQEKIYNLLAKQISINIVDANQKPENIFQKVKSCIGVVKNN